MTSRLKNATFRRPEMVGRGARRPARRRRYKDYSNG